MERGEWRSELDFCGERLRVLCGRLLVLIWLFNSDQLPVTPGGDFLCEQKVTKESHRERVFRLPLSL